ncbi:hypothetical protein ACMSEF_03685 [Bacteroides thetaiotaomicron]|uniref:hypothetical protein n=1 Tax=Bacteroides TaxID=816 RepID=UPI00189D3FA9|nr:hypothetical protein [Bacteroides ovatus]MDC2664704.1 hypothetical protein [Bacteroides ovatus]
MDTKQYLKINYNWTGTKIISEDEIIALYKKEGYINLPLELVKFLTFFYNTEFNFSNNNIDFNIKRILRRNPYYLRYEQFCTLLNVSNITPFAEIDYGYTVLICDKRNNIYGICDDIVTNYGNDYFKMIDYIITNTNKGVAIGSIK